jgi:hypothetical protein
MLEEYQAYHRDTATATAASVMRPPCRNRIHQYRRPRFVSAPTLPAVDPDQPSALLPSAYLPPIRAGSNPGRSVETGATMNTLQGVSHSDQQRALWLSTIAFTICFAVWTIFAIIGVQIKANLGLNETQFGIWSRRRS